jgi:two-component system, LytTR family, sensor histidine kinase AlgZ
MMSRYWLRMIALNVAAALFVAVAFNGVTWHTPWRRALEVFGVGFLFASCIGTLCAVLVPRLAHSVFCRLRFPLTWAVLIAAMIGLGAAGSLVAILILRAIGYIPTAELVAMWFVGSLKVSIIVTLIFGVFATLMESLRARLDEATLALRTKERDEADARRLAAEAQLASLESRVNPHFLFNTLNSIAALVHDDPAAAERVTGALASLMRSSLEAGSTPLVPLDEELRIVRAYLDIERVRFADRLRYSVETTGDPGQATVPRLSLQTLVENSVKYAVAPRREGASIVVRAARSNGRLRLDVEDDGPGFDTAAARSGHGLALLKSRLEMTYGERAALVIDSRADRTRVSIDLPSESP